MGALHDRGWPMWAGAMRCRARSKMLVQGAVQIRGNMLQEPPHASEGQQVGAALQRQQQRQAAARALELKQAALWGAHALGAHRPPQRRHRGQKGEQIAQRACRAAGRGRGGEVSGQECGGAGVAMLHSSAK